MIRNTVNWLTVCSFEGAKLWCFVLLLKEISLVHRRLMQEATQAAPKPLSMLTTVTLEAQEFSMPRSAATPPKLAP